MAIEQKICNIKKMAKKNRDFEALLVIINSIFQIISHVQGGEPELTPLLQ